MSPTEVEASSTGSAALPGPRRRLTRWAPRRRLALGIADDATPSLVFVAAGILLGPSVTDILSPVVLAQLDPVVSVALAVLGVFIGSGFAAARGVNRARWLGGATAEALLTGLAVAAALYLLLSRWQLALPLSAATAALTLGICAAASAAVRIEGESSEASTAAHLADLDDLPVVVAGGLLVSMVARGSSPAASILLAVTAGAVIALAGALLFRAAQGEAERLTFVTGTVVLLGGAAAYASASPLATGCIAGLIWAGSHRATAALVSADLGRLQHALVALLLLVAGASIQFGDALLWLAAPIVLFRLTGKLIGSLVASRLLGVPAGLLASVLAPPGVLGIAVALNLQQVLPTADTVIVSAVTVAIATSELLAVVLLRQDDEP